MYDPTKAFTAEEIALIESSGLTMAEVRDFWSRFPDQELDTAIGGTILEKRAKDEGLTPGLQADRTVNPDVPAPAEQGADPVHNAEVNAEEAEAKMVMDAAASEKQPDDVAKSE